MSKKFNIAVDAMGGDNAPEKVLAGVDLFFKVNKKHDVNFFQNFDTLSVVDRVSPHPE